MSVRVLRKPASPQPRGCAEGEDEEVDFLEIPVAVEAVLRALHRDRRDG